MFKNVSGHDEIEFIVVKRQAGRGSLHNVAMEFACLLDSKRRYIHAAHSLTLASEKRETSTRATADVQDGLVIQVFLCINESLRAVPWPTYFFAHDEGPIRNIADAWPERCIAVLQQPRAIFAEQCGIPTESIFVYEKRYCDNDVRDMDAASIARHRSLYGNSGTVHCAIHFCRLIGAGRIVMVGFDGTGGYAKSIHLPNGGAEHDRIRRDSISLLDTLCIPYEFFQPQDAS